MENIEISVIICTYNSATRIRETLDHLINQQSTEGIAWELLVVDYESTDVTGAICKEYAQKMPVPMKFINESRPGKSAAMVTGFEHAEGEYVCIVDDDNWVAPDYIFLACSIMRAHPDIGMIGGYGTPFLQGEKPEWFDAFAGVFAVGHQLEKAGYTNEGERNWFWGAASVIRKAAWDKIINRGFRFILNPSRDGYSMFKKGFAGGEDQELCFAIQLCGYRLWYEPGLKYTHFISSNRLTTNYLYKTISGTSTSAPVLKIYQSLLTPKNLKGKFKKYLYTVVPLMFLHDIYVLLDGIRQGLHSQYKKITWYSAFIRFRSSVRGLMLLNGKVKLVLMDITKLQNT